VSVDVLVAGLLAGGLYALVGLGLSLVFGVLRLMNLAHGELIVGGTFVASLLIGHFSFDPLVALPFAMLAVAAIAYVAQRFLLTGLLTMSATAPLVATFGLSLIAQAGLQAGFGPDYRSLNASYATSGFTADGVRVQTIYAISFAVGVTLCLATHLLLTRTRAGSAVRAAAADPQTASLLGIDVGRVYALTFAGAAALAAAAGVLTGVAQSFSPTSGQPLLLVGFAVMALGGIGGVGGVLAGGIALGLAQSIAVSVFGGGYRNAVVYIAFLLVIAFRPASIRVRIPRPVRA
jgi:branched-chain amino acid transport system permease protein